jgi:tetratricopeptide (TPR) repeat protein
MNSRPFLERLGYIPRAEVVKYSTADQKYITAAALVMKALFYYGSLVERNAAKIVAPPDFFAVYKTIETAVKLDPYNMDAYYFGQAVMAWDAGRVREANALLEYGMKYRDWDFYLPFFAGFNYAYFLKDYQNAAKHYKRAAELNGDPLYANLAGRYLYESGQTGLALAYVSSMEKSARNPSIKKLFQLRLAALNEVNRIEQALASYAKDAGVTRTTIEELLKKGYLTSLPVDPYGGHFYIDDKGQVKSTSKFAFAGAEKAGHQKDTK